MDHAEHVYDQRTAATRGVVMAVNDNGCAQTMDVQTHGGVLRGGVEVHQPFGFSSVPPPNGAVAVLIANGGDPSDMIALMAAVPLCRLGGLQPGESAVYAADGTRLHIKQGGIVEILAASQVVITAPNVSVTATGTITLSGTIVLAGATTIDGSLQVNGNINATGTISG